MTCGHRGGRAAGLGLSRWFPRQQGAWSLEHANPKGPPRPAAREGASSQSPSSSRTAVASEPPAQSLEGAKNINLLVLAARGDLPAEEAGAWFFRVTPLASALHAAGGRALPRCHGPAPSQTPSTAARRPRSTWLSTRLVRAVTDPRPACPLSPQPPLSSPPPDDRLCGASPLITNSPHPFPGPRRLPGTCLP